MIVGREDGVTLVELVTTMAILGIVLTGITALFTAGIKSQADQQARFDALTELHVGLDKMTRDIHASCSTVSTSTTSVTVSNPPCDGTNVITWCTQGSSSRFGLYRVTGSSCSGGIRYTDFLTTGAIFTYVASNTPSTSNVLPRIHADVTVDETPANTTGSYRVVDDIVFRNGGRT